MWKWRYYAAAAILIGALLISRGAPPLAVFAGLLGVGVSMRRRASRLS